MKNIYHEKLEHKNKSVMLKLKSSTKNHVIMTSVLFSIIALISILFSVKGEFNIDYLHFSFICFLAALININQIYFILMAQSKAISSNNTIHPYYDKYWVLRNFIIHFIFAAVAFAFLDFGAFIFAYTSNFLSELLFSYSLSEKLHHIFLYLMYVAIFFTLFREVGKEFDKIENLK